MASTSLMFPKNWLPNPSPLLAPFTNPAISTNSIYVGIVCFGLLISDNFGSIYEKFFNHFHVGFK